MSHSQFHSVDLFTLRHAWLNPWDKHMTTGRINQVTKKGKEEEEEIASLDRPLSLFLVCGQEHIHRRLPVARFPSNWLPPHPFSFFFSKFFTLQRNFWRNSFVLGPPTYNPMGRGKKEKQTEKLLSQSFFLPPLLNGCLRFFISPSPKRWRICPLFECTFFHFLTMKSFYSWIGFLPLLTSKVTFPSWRFVRSIPSFVSFLFIAPHPQNESPFFQKTCSQVFPYCLQEE